MAIELAVGYVSIVAETSQVPRGIAKSLSGTEKLFAKQGKLNGSAMTKGFESTKPDMDKLAKDVEVAQKRMDQAVEKGSKAQAVAKGKVEVAQAKLNEAIRDHGEDSAKAKQAALNLTVAENKLDAAAKDATNSVDRLNKKLHESREAHRAGEEAANKYSNGWRGIGAKIGTRLTVGITAAGFVAARVSGQQGNKSGNAFVAGFGKSLLALSGGRVLGDLGNKIKDMAANFDRSLPKFAATTMAIGSLSAAVLAGTSNLFALGASLATVAPAALVLPGIIGAGAVAMGVFTMAMMDATTVLADLGPAFGTLQDSVSTSFWDEAAQPIRNLVNTLLPALSGKLNEVSTAMGGFTAIMANSLSGELPVGQMGVIIDNLTSSINGAKAAIEPLTSAFMTLGTVGSTYLPNLSGWIVEVSNRFDGFVTNAAASGEIFDWIDTGIQGLKDLGSIAFYTGGILGGLGKAATEAGGSTLGALADGLQRVSDAINGPVWQGALVTVFEGAHAAMSGLGTAVGSIGDLFIALAPTIGEVLALLGEAVGTLVSGISTALQDPAFAGGVERMVNGLLVGITALAPALEPLGAMLGSVAVLAGNLFAVLGPVLGAAITALAPVITSLVSAITPLVPILGEILITAINALSPIIAQLGSIFANTVVPIVIELAGIFTTDMLPILTNLIANLLPPVALLFQQFAQKIGELAITMAPLVTELISRLAPIVTQLITDLLPPIVSLFGALMDVVIAILPPIMSLVFKILDFLIPVISTVIKVVGWLIDKIAIGLGAVLAWFRDKAVPWFKDAIQNLGDKFVWVKNKIGEVWGNIKGSLKDGWDWISSNVFDPMVKFVTEDIPDAFRAAKDGIGEIWDKVVGLVKEPIRIVVEDVINGGLIAGYNKFNDLWSGDDIDGIKLPEGFARGGIIPGYQSQKKDDRLIPMRSGESVLVPEVTRGLGASTIHALNAAGNSGGASAVRRLVESSAVPRLGHEGHSHGEAAGGPGGPSAGLWGPLQNSIYATGVAHLNGSISGVDMGAVARAWNNMSNVRIKHGSGPNQITGSNGGSLGNWGYAWTNGNFEVSPVVPGNMRQAVAIHELGHVLGHAHDSSGQSIMHPMMRGPQWPGAYDRATMQRVFGGAGKGNPPEGGGGGILDGILDKVMNFVKKPFDSFKNTWSKNAMGEMTIGIADKAIEGILSKVGLGANGDAAANGYGSMKIPLYDSGGKVYPGRTILDNQTGKTEAMLTNEQWRLQEKNAAIVEQVVSDGKGVTLVMTDAKWDDPDKAIRRALDMTAFEMQGE